MTRATCDQLPGWVVVIAGPPCSGKSTLAARLAGSGDVVLDFDVIARALGSPASWLHAEPYRTRAEARMRELMGWLPGHGSGTAYVVRSLPDPRHRATTVRLLRARVAYVVDPGVAECLRRCEVDGRPVGTVGEIGEWYARFRPWSGDRTPDELATQSDDVMGGPIGLATTNCAVCPRATPSTETCGLLVGNQQGCPQKIKKPVELA